MAGDYMDKLYNFDERMAQVEERLTNKWEQILDEELQPALLMMVQDRTIDWQVAGSVEDGWWIEWRKLGQ